MADTALLVKVRGDGRAFKAAMRQAFGATGDGVEEILKVPAKGGTALAPAQEATWFRVGVPATENP